MTEDTYIVCHYDEIGIKGNNRPWFEKKLRQNIRFALHGVVANLEIKSLRGRILVKAEGEFSWDEFCERTSRVLGISYFARAVPASPDIESVEKTLERHLPTQGVASFAVRAKREDKSFALKSPQIERTLGEWVGRKTGWKVDLSKPDLMIRVEWMRDRVLLHFRTFPGPRGLPTGISGRVLCLISGGIDSPVAAYFMMKRGCPVDFIHFHSFPFTDTASQRKVFDLVESLCRHRCHTRLYMVPFADLQQKIVVSAPAPYRIILYRRFMLRVAQEIARSKNILALVTGDNLAQVASQTLENIATIDSSTTLPVFRPLIGFDKQEIIDWAHKIGTFAISIEPHDDCCSWLMPTNPELSACERDARKIEESMDVEGMTKSVLEQITMQEFFKREKGNA